MTETPRKKARYDQHYKSTYQQIFGNFLGPSTKGSTYVHCGICNIDFSCAHAGRNDCKRHIDTKSHKQWESIRKGNRNINEFREQGDDSLQIGITKAEVRVCEIISDMNLSLSTADTLCNNFKQMFPDSKIAQGLRCGRNKATAIIKELSAITMDNLAARMKVQPFTISTDGSNDDTSKQFPLVVRTLDPKTMSVDSELLSIPICVGAATGENIFKLMDEELTDKHIPWENCIAFGCDNANVMTGKKRGVFAFIKEKQSSVFLAGCPLHLVHIAAKKAAQCLPPIDDVLVDIYYYFAKSEKRKSEFNGTQVLFDVEQRKMLKHVCTRWLSITRCIERLIHNWDALKQYFKNQHDIILAKQEKVKSKQISSGKRKIGNPVTTSSSKENAPRNMKTGGMEKSKKVEATDAKSMEEKSFDPSYAEKKVESIFNFVKSPTNKLYALFVKYTLKMFDGILTTLQAEEPKVHILRRSLRLLLRDLLVRFVKPSAMVDRCVEDVDYHSKYNIKANQDLVIGEEAREFLLHKEENHLREKRIKEFYSDVVKYFQTACTYIKEKLPINDKVLKDVEVADVSLKLTVNSTSLDNLLTRFPCLLSFSGGTKDQIMEQFVKYQSCDIEDCKKERMDETWRNIAQYTDETGEKSFCELAKVMLGILTIPHSSAHCERVFSTVRKNRTDQRSSLGDKTLEALLVLKARPGNLGSTEREHSKSTIQKLKGAYYRSLKD